MTTQIEYISELDDEVLLEILGGAVLELGLSRGESGLKAAALAWLAAHWSELRRDLCGQAVVIALINEGSSRTQVERAAALLDLLVSLRTYPAVATLSVYLARTQLERLCDGPPQEIDG